MKKSFVSKIVSHNERKQNYLTIFSKRLLYRRNVLISAAYHVAHLKTCSALNDSNNTIFLSSSLKFPVSRQPESFNDHNFLSLRHFVHTYYTPHSDIFNLINSFSSFVSDRSIYQLSHQSLSFFIIVVGLTTTHCLIPSYFFFVGLDRRVCSFLRAKVY